MSNGVCRSTIDKLNNVVVISSTNNSTVFCEDNKINVRGDLTPHPGSGSHSASAFTVVSAYSSSVFINDKSVVRIGDFSSCGTHAVVAGATSTVFCD